MFKNEGGSKIKLIDFSLTRKFDPQQETKISFGTAEFVGELHPCLDISSRIQAQFWHCLIPNWIELKLFKVSLKLLRSISVLCCLLFLTGKSVHETLQCVTIQKKATEQYFHAIYFILYNEIWEWSDTS